MMKILKISWVVLLLLGTAWLTPKLLRNPGLIQIELLGYQVQMTAIAAVILLLGVFLVVWLLYSLLKAPKKVANSLTANKSRKKFARGLLALSEGKWTQAENLLLQSAKKSPTPELSYMAAARAAVSQNRIEQAEKYLDMAEEVIDNPLTVDLTRCEIWIKMGDADRAIPLLDAILKTYPNNPRAISLLTQASQQTQDWSRLKLALPKAEKLALISHEQANGMKQQATLAEFEQANSPEALLDLWQSLNKKQQQRYLHVFCESGLRVGAFQEVTEHIEKALKQSLDEQLVAYWSALPHNLNHRLKMAEKWLSHHPNNVALMLCNAKIHLAKKHWGEAESLLLEVLKKQPSAEVNQLLGLIYQEQQQADKALIHYKNSVQTNSQAVAVIESDEDNQGQNR